MMSERPDEVTVLIRMAPEATALIRIKKPVYSYFVWENFLIAFIRCYGPVIPVQPIDGKTHTHEVLSGMQYECGCCAVGF